MEKVAGEQGLALQQFFAYKSYSFKNSDRHKISLMGASNLAILIFSASFFHV